MKLNIITEPSSKQHFLMHLVLVLLLVVLFIGDVAVVKANEDACNCGLFQSHTTCRHVSDCSWLNNKCRGTCYNSNQRDVDCNVLQSYCVGPPTESSVCEHRLDMFQQRQQQQQLNNDNDEEGLFSTGLQQGQVEEGDNDVLTVSSTTPDAKSMCEWNDWFCQYSSEQNECQLYPQACNDFSSFGEAQLLTLEEEECLMLGCTWLTNQPHPTCSNDNVKGNLTTTNNKDAFEQEWESKQNKGMSKMITSAAITGIICFIFIGLCWSSVVFCRNGPSQHEIEEEAEAAQHHHQEEDQQSPTKKYNTDGDEVEEGLDLSENSPRHFPLEQDFNIDFDPAQLVQQTKRPSRAERSTSYGESIAATTLSCDVPIRKHRLPYSIPGIPRET